MPCSAIGRPRQIDEGTLFVGGLPSDSIDVDLDKIFSLRASSLGRSCDTFALPPLANPHGHRADAEEVAQQAQRRTKGNGALMNVNIQMHAFPYVL